MARNRRLHGVGGLALTGVLLVGATGCSEASDGADVDVDDDGVSVQDGEGQGFSAEASTEVPDAVAELVELPEAFTAEGTTETTLEAGESTMVVGTIDTDDPAAVIADIEETLAAEGLETLSNSEVGGEMYSLIMYVEDGVQVTVAIIDDGEADEPAEMNVTVMRPTG